MGRGWRDGAGDRWGVGVAEVDAGAERSGGEEQADVSEYRVGDGVLMGVDAERKHHDNATRAGGDREGEGIESLFLEAADLGVGDGGSGRVGRVGFVLAGGAVFLIEERPADHGDDDTA